MSVENNTLLLFTNPVPSPALSKFFTTKSPRSYEHDQYLTPLISIVIGSVDGQFISVFEKLSKLQAKSPFSFAIVVGDLFADPSVTSTEDEEAVKSLLKGNIDVPLPTYFGIGQHALPDAVAERLESMNEELCPNLYFLGKRSITKTSEGIRIVSLGGKLDSNVTVGASKDKYLPFHTEGDARAMYGANSADILITSNWPASVRTGSKVLLPEGFEAPVEEQSITELCAKLKPRYHFSTAPEAFYEREPFYHRPGEAGSEERTITRFLSLASSTNKTKAKWLYAFSIDPKAANPLTLPTDVTPSPFGISKKRSFEDPPTEPTAFSRYSTNGHRDSYRPSKRRRNQPPPGPGECFFCLSNPNLSTHLITSIATDTYMTTAKGPLTLASTHPGLQISCHMLIIPLTHAPTVAAMNEEASQKATYTELQRYRSALNSMLKTKAAGKLGSVAWEISRNRGVHFHWQYVPVPVDTIDKGLVEAAFKVEAENNGYPSFQTRDIGAGIGEGEYFRVWVWKPNVKSVKRADIMEESDGEADEDATADGASSTGTEVQLILPLAPEMRFDIQFGRRVMGKLLGLEKRLDWRECVQTEEEEKEETERFKELFKQFDFSLNEE